MCPLDVGQALDVVMGGGGQQPRAPVRELRTVHLDKREKNNCVLFTEQKLKLDVQLSGR